MLDPARSGPDEVDASVLCRDCSASLRCGAAVLEIADSKQAKARSAWRSNRSSATGVWSSRSPRRTIRAAPVPFGPGSISISTVAGQPIALSRCEVDQRCAHCFGDAGEAHRRGRADAGRLCDAPAAEAPRWLGRMDVTGYTRRLFAICPERNGSLVEAFDRPQDRRRPDRRHSSMRSCRTKRRLPGKLR